MRPTDHVRHLRRGSALEGERWGRRGREAAPSGVDCSYGRGPQAPRAGRRMHRRARARAHRRPKARHHGPHHRRSTIPKSRWQYLDGMQRGDLQRQRSATRSNDMGLSLSVAWRHRNDRAVLRAPRRRCGCPARGNVWSRRLGRCSSTTVARARSRGGEAAILDRAERRATVRFRGAGAARIPGSSPARQHKSVVTLPRAGICAGAVHDDRRYP